MQQTAHLYDFRVTYEPFLLRPGLPPEGMEKPEKLKTISKTGQLYKLGESVGIDFTGKAQRFPNTLIGHQMMEYCKSLDPTRKLQSQVVERVFKAYFTDGLLPNRSLLDGFASSLGFNTSAYTGYMDSIDNLKKTENTARSWMSKVTTGVPFYIINGEPQFSGIQEPDTFVKVFAKFAARK
ncbi:uncharacterized protein [Watersipora subatra]|uniref:uncharacterized protein n=1 Tax=Watersipora subatra TaxID=2589382 RepID=UPI00355C88D9